LRGQVHLDERREGRIERGNVRYEEKGAADAR
jgi:hypothetical protein